MNEQERTFGMALVRAAILALVWVGLASVSLAAPNPVVVGNARFTVETPMCIRLEYSSAGRFVDEPSLFAASRVSQFDGFRLARDGRGLSIDTGVIHLTYTPDGQPFSPSNLRADVHKGGVIAHWAPGAVNVGNLGGTIRTLDGADGPKDLGMGLLSRDGWFLLDDSRSPLLTKDWVEPRPADAGVDWYLFGYGHDYKGALKTLAAVSGPVPLPRKYALGAWYSRYWPYSSADYRQIVAEYGEHGFPLDNMVLDMDWHKDGWTGWSWNRKLLPDAEQLLPWLHSQGLHDTLNLHPADGVGPQEDRYAAFMRDMGVDPSTGATLPFDAANKKYMDTLFADVMNPLRDAGVDFWWLDWQQYPNTRSIPELTNLFWLNSLLYGYSGENGLRGMSFSRWAGWGDQRHPIHFSGDASTSFQMLAFEVPFTSTAGNVGCFFWSHDIGGHNRGRNEESYARWVQFGATSAALRSHSTRDATMDRRPWLYPHWATESMRTSFHLRDELFPYIYSSARETAENTVPLNRPMYVEYPDEEAAYHQAQEYLYGDDLLVAPIVTPGVGPGHVAHQTVWFPPGDWYNFFTGESYHGGTEALVSADIDEFPLYFKGGVPIPMQQYSPRMATAPLNTLVVRAYPGASGQTGRFTLYEDDGETTAYRKGAFAETPLSYVRRGDVVTVTVGAAKGSYAGQVKSRGIVVELPNTARAARATVDGKAVPITYGDRSEATITIPPRPVERATTLVVHTKPAIATDAIIHRIGGVTGGIRYLGGGGILSYLLSGLQLTEDPIKREEILAACGVGLVEHNMAPYLYHGTIQDQFYAPPGLLDGDTFSAGGHSMKIAANRPVIVPGMTHTHRGRTLTQPADVSFTIAGHPFKLPSAASKIDELMSDENVAGTAKVSASGSEDGYSPEGAVDGIVGGYPGDTSQEWSSGATVDAWLQLDWSSPQTVNRIVLYDRPNTTDQVTSGVLTFSDGSSMAVGALPNDAKTSLTVTFPAKAISWVKFTVTGVKAGTQNSGLSEIGVFRSLRQSG